MLESFTHKARIKNKSAWSGVKFKDLDNEEDEENSLGYKEWFN